MVAIACLKISWSSPPTSTTTANLSKFLMRASSWRPSIRWIVTLSRSRRAWLRKTSWIVDCADAEDRGSVTWAIRSRLLSVYATRRQCGDDAIERGRQFARTVEPDKRRLFAEPDQLSARVATVLLHDQASRLLLATHAVQHLHHLPVDQPAKWTRRCRNTSRQQLADFRDNTARELLVHTARDPLGGHGRRQAKPDADDVAVGDQRPRVAEVVGQRTAGGEVHLEGPHQPLPIARHDSRGGVRIHALQHLVQPFRPLPRGHPVEPRTKGLVGAGARKQPA